MITDPMLDILFDEKISGSFHFTPGQAYEEANNGNKSQVHWDMVSIQRPEWGGGEIWFDDELIRKDGLFVAEDLSKLNPDYSGGIDQKSIMKGLALKELIANLPKTETHLHVEGVLPWEMLREANPEKFSFCSRFQNAWFSV